MNDTDKEQETEISPPGLPGIYYGRVTYWFAVAGVLIGITGLGWYLSGGNHILSPEVFIRELWKGSSPEEIWEHAAGMKMKTGHWYYAFLDRSDGLAFFGIIVCCLAAVFGMWAAFAGLLKCPEQRRRGMYKLYVILVVIMAVMLTLSALGVISAEN